MAGAFRPCPPAHLAVRWRARTWDTRRRTAPAGGSMHFIPTAIRGPLFMVAVDRLLCRQRHHDEARDGRPAALRGAVAARHLRRPSGAFRCCLRWATASSCRWSLDKRVLTRNLLELGAILCYVVALANMQIADSTRARTDHAAAPAGRHVDAVRRADRRRPHGADRARLSRRADGGAADHARRLGLCLAGARQCGAVGGARPRRPARRRPCAGHDRRHLGGAGGAGRRRHRAPAVRDLGGARRPITSCCWPAPASS